MLKEIDPRLARVGLLFNPDNVSAGGYWHSIQAVAASMGIAPVQLPVRDADASSRLSMVLLKA